MKNFELQRNDLVLLVPHGVRTFRVLLIDDLGDALVYAQRQPLYAEEPTDTDGRCWSPQWINVMFAVKVGTVDEPPDPCRSGHPHCRGC